MTEAESYADHGERVLAAVRDFAARSAELVALRTERAATKGGRVLSAPNTQRLEGLLEDLELVTGDVRALLGDARPPAAAPSLSDAVIAARATLARLDPPG